MGEQAASTTRTDTLPPSVFTPFLTVLVVWRSATPMLMIIAFAAVLRSPGLGDRRALARLGMVAVAVLMANVALLAWLRRRDHRPGWVVHPAAMGADVAVMVGLLVANAAVLPARTFLLEARDAFNIYLLGTAALWTYLRSARAGVAILGIGALGQVAGVMVNGYPLEAVGTAKLWTRQIWGPVAVLLVWALALIVRRAVAEQREGARLREEAAREREQAAHERAENAREKGETAALIRAHDEVLPLLSAIVRACEDATDPEEGLERIRRLALQADDVIREGFERPDPVWGDVRTGVTELVRQCRQRQRESPRPARIQVFTATGEPALPDELREALLGATEQALRNAEQHARADSITVSLEVDDREVRVIVADDGVGFDPEMVRGGRFGIQGSIYGRLEEVGGRAELDTAPGQGCVWVLAVAPPESGVAR